MFTRCRTPPSHHQQSILYCQPTNLCTLCTLCSQLFAAVPHTLHSFYNSIKAATHVYKVQNTTIKSSAEYTLLSTYKPLYTLYTLFAAVPHTLHSLYNSIKAAIHVYKVQNTTIKSSAESTPIVTPQPLYTLFAAILSCSQHST